MARTLVTYSVRSTSPGQRFRIQAWAPHLHRAGIRVVERPFASPQLERQLVDQGGSAAKAWHALRSLGGYRRRVAPLDEHDAALVYREAVPLGPTIAERWLTRHGRIPFAYDVDDPIFLRPAGSSAVLNRVRSTRKWRFLCRHADVTIAINEEIAECLRPHARRVEVVPIALDLDHYLPRETSGSVDRAVLGFSGSPSTTAFLLAIRESLERLARERAFAVHVVGGQAPFRSDRFAVIERPWSADRERTLLHEFDIGLAPAPDDEWNRHKFPVKVILYMACGVPVVASPLGSPARIIRDGENGFLASDGDEWVEKLRALIVDPELRARMGAAARATVERDYSFAAQIPRVVRLFRELVEPTTARNKAR